MPAPLKITNAAGERNKEPILRALRRALPECGTVLEIASGSGQHAAFFARHLPRLQWQTSERPGELHSIEAWRAESALDNFPAPLALDVNNREWPADVVDAVVCINAVHIMPWPSVCVMVRRAAALLHPGAVFFVYGPYRYRGRALQPGNREFDVWLRAGDPRSGIREFEALDEVARENGLSVVEDLEMPANNRAIWWRREARTAAAAAATDTDTN